MLSASTWRHEHECRVHAAGAAVCACGKELKWLTGVWLAQTPGWNAWRYEAASSEIRPIFPSPSARVVCTSAMILTAFRNAAVPYATHKAEAGLHMGSSSATGWSEDDVAPDLGMLPSEEVFGAKRQDRPQMSGITLPSSPLHSFSPLQLVHTCRNQHSLVSWPPCTEGKAYVCLLLTGLPLVSHLMLSSHQSIRHIFQMWPGCQRTPVSISTLRLGGNGRGLTHDVDAHHQA